MTDTTQPTLDLLLSLARRAGDILRNGFKQDYQVFHKGEIDLVTDVDRRSEAFLIGEIQRLFPDHSIIAEESGFLPAKNGGDGRTTGRSSAAPAQKDKETLGRWYIDPLDGTINFAHEVPIFCVSIAFAEEGILRLAAVYDPMREECFYAESGKGAWLNGSPIQASRTPELIESLLVTGFPYTIRNNPNNNFDLYARFSLLTQGVRRLGSAALDLCYVACGRFEGFWELQLESWDMAAGILIAREAGATVTNVGGDPNPIVPPYSVLAANPSIYPQMLQILREG
jgi:myo-inositol-1(or 4)-monophosphatase